MFEHRRVNRGVVLMEHRMRTPKTSQKEVLKHRVKMINENASIIVACDHYPQDNEMPRFAGIYCIPHHHRISSMFHRFLKHPQRVDSSGYRHSSEAGFNSPASSRVGDVGFLLHTVDTVLPSKRLNLTNMTSNNADGIPEERNSCVLEMIEENIQQTSDSISPQTVHTCHKQTEPARDCSVGCFKAHWPWERTPSTTMVMH
ncbi:hypothetical protein TNCV_3386121 [Trichonephila clavipes]|nr:hypothetical protein TNCV_3386121 [Trichonephila clavipes]